MLNNSLFSDFLKKNGLSIKGESTRDLICLDFDFGSKSYEDEIKRAKKMLAAAKTEDEIAIAKSVMDKIEGQKYLYQSKSRDEIRTDFYENGTYVDYVARNKDGSIKSTTRLKYKMLYRTSAKAKLGQVIFIRDSLYAKAYDWLTMGLGKKMPKTNAKIVEMSAYAPLTTSTIVERIHFPVEDMLILKDKDAFFHTMVNMVRAVGTGQFDDDGLEVKKCVVTQEETDVCNTIWDGMGLIESSILPSSINGMALLRNHMFKACMFRTNIQKFFVDWCYENGHDYYTYEVEDMFGVKHKLKDIKCITTDNAIKWKKFYELMGDSMAEAYSYWCGRINADGSVWGVVKTDHPSKLGQNQQMSYQMVNTIPCTQEDINELATTSVTYVESLKNNPEEFEKFLRANANEINHYEMMADLYAQNHRFADSKWFRYEKKTVINNYVYKLRNGKININADNLTLCGNPYALLLYSVGEDWMNDPTFDVEEVGIQCYTTRFRDGEYLCGIRNPHNSPENLCYFHNTYSDEMERYFPFSDNIMAVNCIGTDVQSRANGCDSNFGVGSAATLFKNQSVNCLEAHQQCIVNNKHRKVILFAKII